MAAVETTALSDFDAAEVRARSLVDFDAASSNVAAAAGMMTAACIADIADGSDGFLSWTYTVRTSATKGLASGQKRVEVFDISTDGGHGNAVIGVITVALIGAQTTAAETTMSDAGDTKKETGKDPAGGRSKSNRSAISPEEGGADADMAPIASPSRISMEVVVSEEPCETAANGGSMTGVFQRIGHEGKFNFCIALVTSFYIVATAIAVHSMADGSRDAIGYLASLFVFGSFGCKTMVPLRILALMSNVAFMTYAVRNQLAPVLVLHALLLPINVVRLWQIKEKRRQASCSPQLSQARA